jgi:hypothetical protein
MENVFSLLRKTAAFMPTFSENVADNSADRRVTPTGKATRLRSRLVELWIFMAIGLFFLIRVVASHSAQQLLSRIGHRHLP